MHCQFLMFLHGHLGVVSLVAVHPSTLGKQLLPKTFGPSNVNIAQQVVRGLSVKSTNQIVR